MNGKRYKIGFHNEQDVRFLVRRRHYIQYTNRPLGSKLISKQKKALVHSSRLVECSSEESSEVNSAYEPSLPSTVSTDLRMLNRSTPGAFRCPDPGVDNGFMVMQSITAWDAFLCIATTLDLLCMQDTGFNIGAPICNLPPGLTPTLQQQIIPHKPYVDMIPWSSMRDRILNSVAAINELEFIQDMGSGDLRVWGSTPWDPMGWEVGPEFAKKWWFLIDDGIIRTTNFWRSQRGEEALVLSPP